MEVSLVSSTGMPKDAVLSLKSGHTRSQGPADTNSPFTFPAGAPEQVVKVDVFKTLGTGYLVPTPKQNKFKQYQVDLEGSKKGMSCELELRPAVNDGRRPDTGDTSAEDTKAMRAYVEKKQIMPSLRDALLLVAKEKPEDPFEFLAKHFHSIKGNKDAPTSPTAKAAPTSPAAKAKAEAAPKAAPAKVEEKKPTSPPAEKADPKAGKHQMISQAPMVKSGAPPQKETERLEVEERPGEAAAVTSPVAAKKNNLKVFVLKATGLRNADWGGKSDPYCCVHLVKNGQKEGKEVFRTATIDNSMDPVWNHKEQDILNFDDGDKLEFKIYDEDPGKTDDFLGWVTLTTKEIMPDGFAGNLKLLEAGKKIEAYLTVKIQTY